MSVNNITPEPLEISSRKFLGHYPMVERADKFEMVNLYIVTRAVIERLCLLSCIKWMRPDDCSTFLVRPIDRAKFDALAINRLPAFLQCDALRCTVFVIVILSVCLSVCHTHCVHMVRRTIMISSPYGSAIILVSYQVHPKIQRGSPRARALNEGGVGTNWR